MRMFWRHVLFLGMLAVFAQGCAKLRPHSSSDPLRDAGNIDLSADQQADVQLAFAQSFEHQGETDRALEAYRAVIKNNHKLAEPHHRIAVLLDKKGKCAEALPHYRAALDRTPDDPRIHSDLGYSYYLLGRWGEAEESLKTAISLAPELRHARTNLGLVLARTGRHQEAFDQFRLAGCQEAEAYANLAHALMLNKQWDAARQHLEWALAANPQLPTARRALDGLRQFSMAGPRPLPPPAPMAQQPAVFRLVQPVTYQQQQTPPSPRGAGF